MSLFVLNVIPFLVALFLAIPSTKNLLSKNLQTIFTSGIMAILFVVFLSHFGQVEEHALEQTVEWVPALGLSLSYYLDGLSLLFVLIVTGIGALIFFYSGFYFDDPEELTQFNTFLMIFTGAMMGVVLAGNILMLFIAWELTSISSFLLIGFKGHKEENARFGAMQALLITGGGGLALILGLLILGTAAGSVAGTATGFAFIGNFSELLHVEGLGEHSWYIGFTSLILLGAFTKSAQFPFHFWLPGAMSAPTPASAFLHSATMVKAGIYLLARFYPILSENAFWQQTIVSVGLFTMLWGAFFAIKQQDLKGLLAYSTISKLGAIVALIGLPEAEGLKAAFIGILAHALYKAALFLVVGTIDHNTGTRLIHKLGGLWKYMPTMGVITIISALSMAGMPFFFGFVAKETLIDAMFESHSTIYLAITLLASVFTVTGALILIWDVFFKKPTEEIHFHAAPSPINYGPGVLALGSLTFGFLLEPIVIPMVELAKGKAFELHLFPGFTTVFVMSMSVLASGFVLFVFRRYVIALPSPIPSGTSLYQQAMTYLEKLADSLLRLQSGKVRYYLAIILGSVAILVLGSGLLVDLVQSQSIFPDGFLWEVDDLLNVGLILLMIMATVTTVISQNHLIAALALGIAGYAIGGIFLIEPAPDVALVQFLVETLATVLIIIMLGRINKTQREAITKKIWSSKQGGLRDVAIATAVGVSVMIFALIAVVNRPERTSPVAQWYLHNTYPEVGVQDIVSAILTDFRGTDTLIEITVFSIAAIGIVSLLLRGRDDSYDLAPHPENVKYSILMQESEIEAESSLNTPFTRIVTIVALPFAILIALSHILYGADAPGDGFTGGVVGGLGISLWYIVFGYRETRRRLGRIASSWFMRVGLALAFLNAVAPLLWGDAFLSYNELDIKAPAGLHFASTLLFEIGIALAIFGSVAMIMASIAHPRNIEPAERLQHNPDFQLKNEE